MTTELSKQSQGITGFTDGPTNPTSRLVKIIAVNAGAQKANVAPACPACQRPFVENGKFSICRHCPYRTPPKAVQEKSVFVTQLKD